MNLRYLRARTYKHLYFILYYSNKYHKQQGLQQDFLQLFFKIML